MSMNTVASGANHQPRVEDDPLVRGHGHFAADTRLPNQAYGVFVRSPHAFARIKSIDAEAARAGKGVLAVLTAADMQAAGTGNVTQHPPLVGRGGKKIVIPHRPPLAQDRVMHIGEPVALVVAETAMAAQDAADLVEVDYEQLQSVVDARAAIAPGAPQLWPDAANNIAVDWLGLAADPDANAREVDRILASAKHVARVAVTNQRMVVASMEPRGATGSYDPANDRYTLKACSQSARTLRDGVAVALNVPKQRLRVVTEDVGGAFGLKTGPYPEYVAVLVAAKMIGRPVHWMSGRVEAFLSDNQARDTFTEAWLALDERGRFLALRIRHLANLGGYIGAVGANIQTVNFTRCFPGMYDIRHLDVSARCVFTNTVPTGPYRGAGRPEANYVLERVVEEAARVSGIDKVRLRRRNMISPKKIPYRTAIGTTYDGGDFAAILDQALALHDYDGFKLRRRAAKARGKYRGVGISCFLEHSGGMPQESAALNFPGDDTLVLALNVQSTGQGHASVFPRIAAQRLGIAPDKIRHQHGDSDFELAGFASVASRSAMTAGAAIVRGIEAMLSKGKTLAAAALEAAESDMAYKDGRFEVIGTDRRIALFDLAKRAAEMARRGEIPESLDTRITTETPLAFPNGCHIAEVEVDPQTGDVATVAYTAVDDAGNVLDPMILEGQLHGALAQGIGQALKEVAAYESGSGQLVTASFMDYAMPRAEDMPPMKDASHPVPATTNPLGVKGVGEAATIASIAAVMNAIADAIPNGAAAHMDMPATPERVWQACRKAAMN